MLIQQSKNNFWSDIDKLSYVQDMMAKLHIHMFIFCSLLSNDSMKVYIKVSILTVDVLQTERIMEKHRL